MDRNATSMMPARRWYPLLAYCVKVPFHWCPYPRSFTIVFRPFITLHDIYLLIAKDVHRCNRLQKDQLSKRLEGKGQNTSAQVDLLLGSGVSDRLLSQPLSQLHRPPPIIFGMGPTELDESSTVLDHTVSLWAQRVPNSGHTTRLVVVCVVVSPGSLWCCPVTIVLPVSCLFCSEKHSIWTLKQISLRICLIWLYWFNTYAIFTSPRNFTYSKTDCFFFFFLLRHLCPLSRFLILGWNYRVLSQAHGMTSVVVIVAPSGEHAWIPRLFLPLSPLEFHPSIMAGDHLVLDVFSKPVVGLNHSLGRGQDVWRLLRVQAIPSLPRGWSVQQEKMIHN